MTENSVDKQLRCSVRSLPQESVHIIKYEDIASGTVNNGIVFYHALWSGQSMASLNALTDALLGCVSPPHLYLFNADDMNSLSPEQVNNLFEFFGPIGAYGETVWIIDSKIVARDAICKTGRDILPERLNLFRSDCR